MRTLSFIAVLVLAGLAAAHYGYLDRGLDGLKHLLQLVQTGEEATPPETRAEAEEDADQEVLYWYDPMHPDVHFDEPGRSPFMDMDLVPKHAEEEVGIVRVPPAVTQNMNIRTARAERDAMQREINTFGAVEYDEERISHAHIRVEGWIERLMVQAVGEHVRSGQVLFELYSPALVNAQDELLEALRSGREPLIRAARERLRALGMAPALIDELEQNGRVRQLIPIHAHHGGVVISLGARHGMYVTPGTEIMALADLSEIWVIADVFERQLDWIRAGDRAEVRLPFRPGKHLEGTIDYIYPDLNRKTRTIPVRLRFKNPDGLLKPGMYTNVTIFVEPRPDVLVVPREAVIRTGREARVITHLGEGRFQAREVLTGMMTDDHIEILAGLDEGDEVVVSGQFLIDSEARVRAAVKRLEGPQPGVEPPPEADTVTGEGVVRRIDAEVRRINISHEPIPEMDWPEMTMDFLIADDIDLEAVAEEDAVRFEMRREPDADGMYVIIAITPADGE